MQTTATTPSLKPVRARIESAIEPIKALRFLFEAEGNLSPLQGLEAALMAEHILLEITMWGVAQPGEKDNP